MTDPAATSSRAKSFAVVFPEVELTVDQIWPDGNAPENPTVDDVVAQMKPYGRAPNVIDEWNLIDHLEVYDGSVSTVYP